MAVRSRRKGNLKAILNIVELNRAIKIAKSLIYLPGANTALTLSTEKDHITICADTAGHKILAKVPAEIKKKGSILVEMLHLSALSLKGKTATFETGKDADSQDIIHIKSGRSSYKIYQVEGDPQNFEIPVRNDEDKWQVSTATIKKALNLVWFDHEDDKEEIRLIAKKGSLNVETTDGYRAAFVTIPMPMWTNKKTLRIVLKKKTWEAMLAGFDKESVWVSSTDSTVAFHTDDSIISVPLITETLMVAVDTTMKGRIEEDSLNVSFKIKSAELAEAAKEAANVVEEIAKFKSVQTHLKINQEKKRLTIATTGDIGSYSTSVNIDEIEIKQDKNLKFCVLSRHLKEIAAVASKTSENVIVSIYSKMIIIKSDQPKDCRAVYALPQI